MAVFRFSSEVFPERDRVAAIQDIWAPVTQVDITPLDDSGFSVDATALVLPELAIGWGQLSAFQSNRTRAQAAANGENLVLCLVANANWSALAKGGETVFCDPGEVYLNTGDHPSTTTVPEVANSVLNISIPRAILAPVVADLDAVSNQKLPSTPPLRLMTRYVLSLVEEMDGMPSAALERCGSHILDLTVLALGAMPEAAHHARMGGLRAARLAEIKADIVANSARPDLSLTTVAARHGISPHYLRALFSGAGTTFSDFVRQTRLARAHRLITSPAMAGRRIGDLVFEAGFSDVSTFNRLFRRTFGMTPSDARTVALQHDDPPPRHG